MAYEFQSRLFNTAREMHDAIAHEWMTGGGANDNRTIAGLFAENSDGLLAIECRAHWNLDDNADFQPELLVDGVAKVRRAFRPEV